MLTVSTLCWVVHPPHLLQYATLNPASMDRTADVADQFGFLSPVLEGSAASASSLNEVETEYVESQIPMTEDNPDDPTLETLLGGQNNNLLAGRQVVAQTPEASPQTNIPPPWTRKALVACLEDFDPLVKLKEAPFPQDGAGEDSTPENSSACVLKRGVRSVANTALCGPSVCATLGRVDGRYPLSPSEDKAVVHRRSLHPPPPTHTHAEEGPTTLHITHKFLS
ncbi:hypothetical protein PR048_007945 [Dryococelus australis]|uniref:Uncharacterized protein n=1 Tax=Dryococelus australis TaxID=614101 RepID=A0ABQ9HVV6_9NEOP|nr:hypothetical protein PR048_007945 [Dryococelus australis]